MAIIVILAILFSCILLILCLPVSYALTIHIGTPFHIEGQGRWGRKLADASWSYTLGEEPHHELHMCWKRSLAVKESVEPPLPTAEEEEKAWDELEKESQRLTYEDLLRQEGPDAPAQSDAKEAKKKETAHTPVLSQLLQCRLFSGFLHLAVAPARPRPNPPLHPDRHRRPP